MWAVVLFKVDNIVEVVPMSWINKGSSAWPKTSNHGEIKKNVCVGNPPNKYDFHFYKICIMSSNIGTVSLFLVFCYFILPYIIENYSDAEKKCDKARIKSDLSSDSDNKNKKFKKQSTSNGK